MTHGPNGRRFVWLKYDPKFSFREVAGGMSYESSQSGQIGDRMYERPGKICVVCLRMETGQLGLFPSRPVSQLGLWSSRPGPLCLFYLANCDAALVLYTVCKICAVY